MGVRCETCGWCASVPAIGPDGYLLTVVSHVMFNESHRLLWPEDVGDAPELSERARAVADGYIRGVRAGREQTWSSAAELMERAHAAEKR